MRRDGRTQRGQALVEMALGLLVFVTILIFGIYFAEVGYLSAKVPQAAAFALYEGTGKRITQYAPTPSPAPYDQNILGASRIDEAAKARFRDFDALAGNGGTSLSKVFAQASSLEVSCEEINVGDSDENRIRFAPSPTPRDRVYFDVGGTVCSAQARLDAVNMTRDFMDDENFNVDHYSQTGPIDVCAFGRAQGGACPGKVAILYGDWGLAGPSESGSCMLSSSSGATCTGNPGYYDAVRAMYQGAGSDARAFAVNWAGSAPAHGGEFFMSYSGVENDYRQTLGGHGSVGAYNTAGPENGQRRQTNSHFLGVTPP